MPSAPFDYLAAVRERLILLLTRDAWVAAAIGPANRTRPNDPTRYGLRHKPAAGQKADFPQCEIRAGDGTFEAFPLDEETTYGELEAAGPDDGRAVDATQEFTATIIHEADNGPANDAVDVRTVAAWRAGGRKLADPAAPGSGLPYVIGWTVRAERRVEFVKEGTRAVTRHTITVRLQFQPAELLVTTP